MQDSQQGQTSDQNTTTIVVVVVVVVVVVITVVIIVISNVLMLIQATVLLSDLSRWVWFSGCGLLLVYLLIL